MKSFFHFDINLKNFMFKDWNVKTASDLAVACVIFGILSMIFEAFRVITARVQAQNKTEDGHQELLPTNDLQGNSDYGTLPRVQTRGTRRGARGKKMVMSNHIFLTWIHMIQLFTAYVLMLALMTYNVWIFVAMIIASGLAYFFYGLIPNAKSSS